MMIFQAVLKNPKHEEYGVATVPFPIPPDQYDHILDLLKPLGIGAGITRDCQVEEIKSKYYILKRLEGGCVNLDELDYLAKRLDSFCIGEDAQFQGMAVKLGISSITDLINLTFCCQQATVITDFSDWKRIGQNHFLLLNGGCATTERLEQLDARHFALDLICNHEGYVTPYGVVYDNGMRLEQVYCGKTFPQYAYNSDSLISFYVFKQEAPDELLWLELPMPDSQLERMLLRIGASSSSTLQIEDVWSELLPDTMIVLDYNAESILDLNHMAVTIAGLDKNQKQTLVAAIGFAEARTAAGIQRLAEGIDLFDFYPDVNTPEDYGRFIIQESGYFQYDAELDEFYIFERYGNQRMQNEMGEFRNGGYLAYRGVVSIPELLAGVTSERLEESEAFEMGGIR